MCCLKISEDNEKYKIVRFKINTDNNKLDLKVYDDNKSEIDYLKIKNTSRCISIIHLKNMWYNNGNYGYMMYVLQIKIFIEKPISNSYLFIDSDINNTNSTNDCNDEGIPIKNDERFQKYFKMLKFNIPIYFKGF